MAQLDCTELQVGMTLSQDVKDRRGRLLVPAETALTERHLHAFKLWGIQVVEIEGQNDVVIKSKETSLHQDVLEQAEAQTRELFSHNADISDHPLFKALFTQSTMRLARQLDEGNGSGAHAEKPQEKLAVKRAPARKAHDTHRYSVGNMIRRTKTVSSLPVIYHEIVEVVNHPRSSATDVANIISSDTGLTARLLRVVNSAFYGFPTRIETVSRAVTMVGTNELCDLALATSVTSAFGEALDGIVDMSMFWRHSIYCGSVARILADRQCEPNTERYFVAGLLHDIGRLVIFAQIPDVAREIVDVAASENKPVCAVEKETLECSHANVGEALLEEWNIAMSHREAVGCHHHPAVAQRYPAEAAVNHVSEVITNAMRAGRSGDSKVPPLSAEAWDRLGVDAGVLPSIIAEAEIQVKDLMGILEVGQSA